MGLETKQNEKTRSLPQISGVIVAHHNMVSPGAPPPHPSDATASAPLATPGSGKLLHKSNKITSLKITLKK